MKFKKLLGAIALAASLASSTAWATCSNYATFVNGQTLTASALNSLQTNYTNCVNAVLDGDTFTGNVLMHSGADLNIYSDTGSTLKAAIDGATGAAILGVTAEGFHTNCGFSVSGSTFTIAGFDGTALSATNPCVVGVRSNTVGRTALAYFTANVTATFGATSNTDGNLFGVTDANWASTMPIFLGLVYDGTTPYFTISRLPYVVTGAAATAFCQKDDTDCDAQLDMMILTTGLTLANWVNLPVTQVGWFDATYATTNSAWTFAVTGKNGFNDVYRRTWFTFPVAQNGAAASTHMLANGGTAPIFSTTDYSYNVQTPQICINYALNADAGTDGAGAVAARASLPYAILTPATGLGTFDQLLGASTGATTITGGALTIGYLTNATTYVQLQYPSAATTISAITNAMFSNGARTITANFCYPAM